MTRDVGDMRMSFNTLVRLAKTAWRNFLKKECIMSLIIITACMFILGVSFLFVVNLNNVGDELTKQVGIRVFIQNGIAEFDKQRLESDIMSLVDVKDVIYIDKEQALEDFLIDNPEYNSALDLLPENPLPDSYDVELKDFSKVVDVATSIGKMEFVDSLSYGQGYADNLMKFMNIVWVVTGGLCLISIFVISAIIGNSIKQTVIFRQREINIMKLVGATDRYIQIPFVFEGLILGFLGSILAVIVLLLGYRYVVMWVEASAPFIPMVVNNFTLMGTSLIVIFIGSIVGAFSSLLPTKKLLKK